MSEIHIGPHARHTRDDAAHDTHTYDREINLKAIGKWMGGLLILAIVIQILMWWLLRGLEGFDKRNDPQLLPIERETKLHEELPPEPRLQVGVGFERLQTEVLKEEQPGTDRTPGTRSDFEDMQALRKREDEALSTPSWIDRGQGRVRVPIDVAMEVIASRGAAAEAPPTAPADGQQPQPAGAAQGQPQAAPPPPASQEQ